MFLIRTNHHCYRQHHMDTNITPTKKRKLCQVDKQKEDDELEQTMDMFFAQIRYFHEARERLIKGSSYLRPQEKKMTGEKGGAPTTEIKPAAETEIFKREDFIQDSRSRRIKKSPGLTAVKIDEKEELKGGVDLDLRLGL